MHILSVWSIEVKAGKRPLACVGGTANDQYTCLTCKEKVEVHMKTDCMNSLFTSIVSIRLSRSCLSVSFSLTLHS